MRALVVLAAFTLAACQTPCPAPDRGPVTVNYSCEDGSELRVTFTHSPDVARIEQEGYTTLTMPARISGAGYRYVDGGAELRGHGAQADWTRPGSLQTRCSEATPE